MVVLRLPHFSREIKCLGGEDVYVTKYQRRVKVYLQYCTESNARKKGSLHKLLLHGFGRKSQVAGGGEANYKKKEPPMQMPLCVFAMVFL